MLKNSANVKDTVKSLLHQSYCNSYKTKEEGGAMYFGWLDRILIAASAWHREARTVRRFLYKNFLQFVDTIAETTSDFHVCQGRVQKPDTNFL